MIKGIVMDFDGLIFDTEWHHYEVYRDIFQEQGAVFQLEQYAKGVGTQGAIDPRGLLAEQTGEPVDSGELARQHEQEVHRRLEKLTEPRSGVRELLQQAQQLGLRLGLASSSDRAWVEKWLRHLGLFEEFEVIFTSDDVERVKPDPALYLLAAAGLDLKPEEVLVFEDSYNGSEAALKAGAQCVVVTNRVTEQMNFGPVFRKLTTFRGLDLQSLLQEIDDQL